MTITTDLAAVLSNVQRPGDFCTSGVVDIHPLGLDVEGVGPVALPLLPVQAEALVAVADQAPYGRGDQTILDPTVRRTWQIDAARVRLTSRHWPGILDGIVARVADGLGVSGPVTAELYKLLVYDAGGFFLGHRDTEKAPGMFATLVIVLPSLYQGGELVVQHDGREVRLDLRRDDPAEAAFAAFYADCRHEVHPVTAGWRLTLIYNLCRTGTAPEPPRYDAERARLAVLLRQWPEDGPEKLVYPLEHAYTPASLSFAALKGADAARAAVLTPAAEDAGCDLHLALLTIEESGSAEHSYRRRRWRDDVDDEDDFEVMEVLDGAQFLSDWQRPDGSAAGLGAVPLEDGEVSPPGALEDLTPTEQSFHEATGNEGASFERSYRLAALVLWPGDRRLAVINQAGLSATLPYLADLTGRWQASGGTADSALWAEAHALSGLMLRSWPMDGWRSSDTRSDAAAMLETLARLGDGERIAAFLADIAAAGIYEGADNAAIIQALAVLPAARAAELLRAVIAGNAATRFADCSDLLARAVATGLDLRSAAMALLDALPGDPARRAPPAWPWEQPPAMTPDTAVDVLRALEPVDPALAEAAVAILLAWPQTWGPDAVLVPAAVALSASDQQDTGAAGRLQAAAADHLRRRIAEPLAPPADWAREATLTCTCKHCGELARFLADPARESWSFKAVQADRSHVEGTIRSSVSDLATSTLRRGSPHTLVCTKTQASYQRRVRQRHKDLTDLARIEGA